ncbi:phage/plasmid primase, P4 family [Agathobacter ruminis]|jgi:phage/plasmid primase, P4 family, C-terminal domain|uniref:DNA primase n=1 Tax=Agathobacter ruminis TaxID=1712665 RepID=A0A2G3E1J6_9FIRM|nr:phage/plasmid primase, P4 family [Agathobacter ruminis]MDC7301879.1 phage/plasmid primase, P4 family [Agathobacter ruminis]PHU37124.1 DNA primase [Agathobacter ruminis]
MQITMFTADCTGQAANCSYPNRRMVTTPEEMQEAVRFDHVCAEYKGNYRSIGNFARSDVVVMDIDNDHTEDPAEWITPEKLDQMLPDISYVIAFSRNHMKVKDGKAARPKFHVYFQITETSDAGWYAALKKGIKKRFDFFDGNALDAARFIFGSDAGEVVWHEGWMTIDEEVEPDYEETESKDPGVSSGPILEGSRNNTMSRFAGRVLKKYGVTDRAREAFELHARRCDPPLPEDELNTIWNSAVKFYKNTVCTQPGYVEPDEYNSEFDSLKPEDFSDMGEAKALIKEYRDELLYTDATQFLSYDGMCWRENRQKAVGAVEEFLDMQLVESGDQFETAVAHMLAVDPSLDEITVRKGGRALEKLITPQNAEAFGELQTARAYYGFVMKYRNYKHIADTQNTAKPMVATDINLFDAQEDYLNTPGGTYDLAKGLNGMMPHKATDLLTKITNCAPGDEGRQLWEDALQLFFCGDQDLIDYVQMTVGMAAVGKVYVEALIIAYGEGRNGKSTFWNTISRVLGTYSGAMSADSLTANCRRNVKPEIAELKGKRLIIAAELEEGTRLSTSILKQLCSTDQIRGEKKFKDPFDFTPSHTAVLYTNHLPKVSASDDGTWRRLIVIPFHAKIEGSSDIKNYADYLFNNAGPAVMSWIIEGAKKVIEREFKIEPPKVVANAIAEYRGMNDWLSHFLEDCCVTGDGLEQKSGDLYQEYRAYCLRTGEYARNNADFIAEIEKRGFMRKKKKSGMWVQGLQLKDTDFAD